MKIDNKKTAYNLNSSSRILMSYMKISYLDKVMYAENTSRWLMGQLLNTEKTKPFVGYKGKGLEWGKIDQNVVNDVLW